MESRQALPRLVHLRLTVGLEVPRRVQVPAVVRPLALGAEVRRRAEVAEVVMWEEAWVVTLAGHFDEAAGLLETQA